MHTLNIKETSQKFGIKLKPFIFRDCFELHGISVTKTTTDDEFPESPEYAHTESLDGRVSTKKLTAKGQPDKRAEVHGHYASGTAELAFCHAFVQLLDAEKQQIFGDNFRTIAIRRSGRIEVLEERLESKQVTQQQFDSIVAEVTAEFDEMVEEAKRLIIENRA